jgi:serine/arginine repetitive matrix protein 2
MYNGIGLETARGSGTNGYVQRNMAFVRPRKDKVSYKTEEEIAKSEALLNREPNLEILEHERKRKIELKCMELQELMEDQGYDQDAIEQKVDAFRQKLIEKDSSEKPQITLDESGRPIATGTHQIAAASMDRNKKLREAFGISADYVDGSSMDPLRKQKEIDARAAAKLKYNIIKDPEDDLPPVKVKNMCFRQIWPNYWYFPCFTG